MLYHEALVRQWDAYQREKVNESVAVGFDLFRVIFAQGWNYRGDKEFPNRTEEKTDG